MRKMWMRGKIKCKENDGEENRMREENMMEAEEHMEEGGYKNNYEEGGE